jgi:hypothetical protein
MKTQTRLFKGFLESLANIDRRPASHRTIQRAWSQFTSCFEAVDEELDMPLPETSETSGENGVEADIKEAMGGAELDFSAMQEDFGNELPSAYEAMKILQPVSSEEIESLTKSVLDAMFPLYGTGERSITESVGETVDDALKEIYNIVKNNPMKNAVLALMIALGTGAVAGDIDLPDVGSIGASQKKAVSAQQKVTPKGDSDFLKNVSKSFRK